MRVALVLIALLALAACGESRSPAAPSVPAASVQGITWKLEAIQRTGAATITIANPELYTLVFEADGRVNVRADCNTCNGRYQINGGSVAIAQMACTQAFCGTAIDVAYAAALGEVQRLTRTGNQLLVEGAGLTLRFRN